MENAARLQVLAQASHMFAMVATDYRALLQALASTTSELIGDGCLVTLIDDAGAMYNAASAHRDPVLQTSYRDYLARLGSTTSATVAATVARTGEPKLVSEVNPAAVVAASADSLKPLVKLLNVHSFCVVPIRARGTIIGTLSLQRSAAGRGYTTEDLTLLQDLADRAGLAITSARLYDTLEKRVRDRTAELEAANRDLEAFSYSVAHDLRSPLRSIDGFSLAVLDDFAAQLPPEGVEHLKRVRAAVHRMDRLIDDLLSLASVTRGVLKRADVDVSELASDIAVQLRSGHPGRPAEFHIEEGMRAQGDRGLVEVALVNLMGNAWKFTSKTQKAVIEVGLKDGAFCVRDNGAGFNPAYQAKLFGVFQRLHSTSEFEGTGIGLATVARIVQRHGGKVWATGAVGEGAAFYFTLR